MLTARWKAEVTVRYLLAVGVSRITLLYFEIKSRGLARVLPSPLATLTSFNDAKATVDMTAEAKATMYSTQ